MFTDSGNEDQVHGFKIKKYLFQPLGRAVRNAFHMNGLLFRVTPLVAICLPFLVVASSVLLYAQGKFFARLISAIYNNGDIDRALMWFFGSMGVSLITALLVRKLTTSERFHIREFFDPLIAVARNMLGMKSFSHPHNDRLNQANDGAFSIKFFAPYQVAFISQAMNVALGIGTMAYFGPSLLPYFLGPLIILLLIDFYLAAKAADVEETAWEIFSECTEAKNGFIYPDRLKGVLLFGMGTALIDYIKRRSAVAFNDLRRQNMNSFWLELVVLSGTLLLVYYTIRRSLMLDAAVEIRIFMVTTVLSVTVASKALIEKFTEQLIGSDRVENVLEYERQERNQRTHDSKQPADGVKLSSDGSLELRNLTVGYSPGKNVIEDASALIPPGSLVHVFGANGSGKTTLVAMLSGLYDLPPGMAFFDGVDLSTISSRQKMQEFRQLTQDTVSFRHSFRETLGWAAGYTNPEECPEELIWKALEMGCLADKVRQAPLGLDQSLMIAKVKKQKTKAKQEQYGLSGGEMKRLNHSMFYIGLLNGAAKVAILDEPFNNIDPEIAGRLRINVRELPGIRLVITHDARHYIQDSDLVLFVDKRDDTGKVPRSYVILKTHGELLEMPSYRKYLGITEGAVVA